MERIASFCVDHDKVGKGMYISRIDGDIVTYDIRMTIPNGGVYLENDGIHTFEHLFATYVRNTPYSQNIIYVGPMGCCTGFYFLTRGISDEIAIKLMKDTVMFIASYEGEIPGVGKKECGNYLSHSLPKAKSYAKDLGEVLKNWTVQQLQYAQ